MQEMEWVSILFIPVFMSKFCLPCAFAPFLILLRLIHADLLRRLTYHKEHQPIELTIFDASRAVDRAEDLREVD